MIDLSKYNDQFDGPITPITSASILVTENCNLRCTYCFEKHKNLKMSPMTADKAVDFLIKNAVNGNISNIGMTMFGGEPTLAVDIVERMVRRGWEQADKYNKACNISMITNGTIVTPQLRALLSEAIQRNRPISVQLSIDGAPHVQDKYRITADGHGSSKMVEKNIPVYKEIYGDLWDSLVSVHGCLNRETISHLYESFLYFKEELGFHNIWFIPVCEEQWEDKHVEIYYNEMEKIYNYVMQKYRATGDRRYIEMYAPLDKALLENEPHIPCGAGRNYGTITSLGEIYPCHHIYFNDPEKESLIGNIWDGVNENSRRIYTQYDQDDLSCSNCDHHNCYRCIAVNLVHNGSLFSQIKGQYCGMMKVDYYFQNKIKEEINKMGLMSRESQRLTNEEAGFECGQVYREYGDCYIVDMSKYKKSAKEENTVQNNTGRTVLETWEDNGMHYEKVKEPDGSINIYDRPIKGKEPEVAKGTSCGGCKKPQTSDNSEFEQVVSDALALLLRKVDTLEKIILEKSK